MGKSRKRLQVGALVLGLALAGCSVTPGGDGSESSAGAASQKSSRQDQTVDGKPVILTVNSEAVLKEQYASVAGLNSAPSASAIVKGIVSDVRGAYDSDDDVAYSVLTVDVQQVYKGNPGKTITVWEDGGYVPVQDMLSALAAHMDTAALTAAQLDGYVDERFEGAAHSEVGDTVIMYLSTNPNPGQGGYQQVSSVYGRFILNPKTDSYERPSAGPKHQAVLSKGQFESTLAALRE